MTGLNYRQRTRDEARVADNWLQNITLPKIIMTNSLYVLMNGAQCNYIKFIFITRSVQIHYSSQLLLPRYTFNKTATKLNLYITYMFLEDYNWGVLYY